MADLPPLQHPYPLRGCNSGLGQYSNTPARNASRSDAGGPTLHHSARPDSRTTTRTATRLSSPKSCPTKLVVCRLQTPMASEVGRTKRLVRAVGLDGGFLLFKAFSNPSDGFYLSSAICHLSFSA